MNTELIARANAKAVYLDNKNWFCEAEFIRELVGALEAAQPAPQVPMTDADILSDKTLRYYFGLNGGNGPVSDKGLKIVRAIEAHHNIGVKS